MLPQYFKGDETELKYDQAGANAYDLLSGQKTIFFDEAYDSHVLAELLYDSSRAPLANSIPRSVFRQSFSAIVDALIEVGTFEAYLSVFRKIFGDSVTVTFAVPAPGKLEIDIVASGVGLAHFVSREIFSDAYVFFNMVTQDGDNISFQSIKGLESQYEVEQMLFEMVAAGIYTEISLTLGA